MANKYYNRLKQRLAFLESVVKERYFVSKEGDRDCEHEFNDHWQLTSDSGIVFCDWMCEKCGMIVTQTVGERLPPKNVPKKMSSWQESNL